MPYRLIIGCSGLARPLWRPPLPALGASGRWHTHQGGAPVNRSTAAAPHKPSTPTNLSGLRAPATSTTFLSPIPNHWANISQTATLARPCSGGATTLTFTHSPSIPTTSSMAEPGATVRRSIQLGILAASPVFARVPHSALAWHWPRPFPPGNMLGLGHDN